MTDTLKAVFTSPVFIDFIFWSWIMFAAIDLVSGGIGWLELRQDRQSAPRRLSKVLFAGAQRSAVSIVGLTLFGVNIKAHPLFLLWGVWSVAYKAYATIGWLLTCHGVINGNGSGFWGLFKRRKDNC